MPARSASLGLQFLQSRRSLRAGSQTALHPDANSCSALIRRLNWEPRAMLGVQNANEKALPWDACPLKPVPYRSSGSHSESYAPPPIEQGLALDAPRPMPSMRRRGPGISASVAISGLRQPARPVGDRTRIEDRPSLMMHQRSRTPHRLASHRGRHAGPPIPPERFGNFGKPILLRAHKAAWRLTTILACYSRTCPDGRPRRRFGYAPCG